MSHFQQENDFDQYNIYHNQESNLFANVIKKNKYGNKSIFANRLSAIALSGTFFIVVVISVLAGLGFGGVLRLPLTANDDETVTVQNMVTVAGELPEQLKNCGMPEIEPFHDLNLPIKKKRIINGKEARTNSWPWIVSLRSRVNRRVSGHLCGGTLV